MQRSIAALAIAPDDSIVVTGRAGGGFGTIKYAPTGEEAWNGHYAAYLGAVDVAVDDVGNVYTTGSDGHYKTVSYTPTGEQRWLAINDSPYDGSDNAAAIAVFGPDTIYVTGQSDGSDDTQGGYPDFATLRYFQFTGSCIGNERLRADCLQRCRTGAFEIAGTIKSQLPAETPITFTLDGAEPKTETIRPNGKARTKWKNVAEGPHVVRVEECGIDKTTDCCP